MVRRTHRPESPPTDTAIPGAVEFVLISRRGWVAATARSSWHPAAHGAKDHYLLMPLTSRIGAGICRVLDQLEHCFAWAWALLSRSWAMLGALGEDAGCPAGD